MLVTSLALNLWSWQIIDRQPQREASERFDLQQDRIIRATENRMLAYQNILDGAQGLLAPGGFMPIAEKSGLAVPIGKWMLRGALQQVRTWKRAGPRPLKSIRVKLSARQFAQADLADFRK